jgi:gamma-glutamyltranspeptidase/glutathione hydrolase
VALLEVLNILREYEALHEDFRLEQLGPDHPQSVHVVAEALKHALADRAEYLGDADFADVPVERLIGRDYARELARRIDPARTKPRDTYGRFQPVADGGTSHFSIVDSQGNAVACTETINTSFGSYVVEPEFGIVFNNQMDDFAAVPGKPNAFGLIQSEANAVAAGKKPLSSMSPTILLEDGKAVYVAGASGGPRIISATLQVLLNMTRFGMTPEEAVRRPRFHHQWLPEPLLVEPPLFDAVKSALEKKGHAVERADNLAATQAAWRNADGLRGASDPRKGGKAAGY